jgi:hypothetical protein
LRRRRLTRARRLGTDERATASLETVLVLPFVFLIIALLFNLGYGSFMRMRTAAAARFGATLYVYHRSDGAEAGTARAAAREEVQKRYFLESDPVQLDVKEPSGRGKIKWEEGVLSGLAGALAGLLDGVSGRDHLELTVPREVPTGTLLPETPAKGKLVLAGNTWTCRQVSLTMQRLTGLPGELAGAATGSKGLDSLLSAVGGSFFLFLGMQATLEDPCE